MTVTHSPTLTALAAALAKAQGAIAPALKDATNPHFCSHYASLASIVEAVRPALADNGLSVVQTPLAASAGYIALETRLLHASGEWLAGTATMRVVKDDPQGAGSAYTYLRRYALGAVIGCTASDDDDANAASTPPRAEHPRSASTPAPRPPTPTPTSAVASPAFAHALAVAQSDGSGETHESVQLFYCQSKSGVSKAGRDWTSWRIGWVSPSGEKLFGSTFSSDIGEQAASAKAEGRLVTIGYRAGERGNDILTLSTVVDATTRKATDDIPF